MIGMPPPPISPAAANLAGGAMPAPAGAPPMPSAPAPVAPDFTNPAPPVQPPPPEPISLEFRDDSVNYDPDDPEGKRLTLAEFGRWMTTRIRAGVDGRRTAGMDDRVRTWRDQYENVVRMKNFPWPDCSNLSVPFTMSQVETIHSNLYKTRVGVAPFFEPEIDSDTDEDAAELKNEFLQSKLESRMIDWRTIVRRSLFRSIIDRTAIIVPTWDVVIDKVSRWVQIDDKIRAELKAAGTIKQIKGKQNGDWATIRNEEETYRGVRIGLVDVLNYFVYPSAAKTQESATIEGDRLWYSKSDLWSGVKSGLFDYDAVDKLTAHRAGGSGPDTDEAGGDRERMEDAGIRVDTEITDAEKPYEIFRCIANYDEDGDGIEEKCLVYVELHTSTILRAELYPYFHGRSFYCLVNPFERPGMLYGYSLCEKLEMIQAEMNAMHNSRTDRATLENNAPVVVSRDIKRDFSAHPLSPSDVIPVDDVDKAIKQVVFGTGNQQPSAAEAELKAMGQEVTGVGQTLLGQPVGKDVTNGEMERTLQSTNTRFDVISDSCSVGYDEAANQIIELYAQYQGNDEYKFVPQPELPNGKKQIKVVTPEIMQMPVTFRAHGTSALANPIIQAQKAEKLWMLAERDPTIIEDDVKRWFLEDYWMKYVMQIRNPTRFIGTLEEAQARLQAKNNAPPPEPETKVSRSERPDDVAVLAGMLKSGEITLQDYLQAGQAQVQVAVMLAQHPAMPAPGALATPPGEPVGPGMLSPSGQPPATQDGQQLGPDGKPIPPNPLATKLLDSQLRMAEAHQKQRLLEQGAEHASALRREETATSAAAQIAVKAHDVAHTTAADAGMARLNADLTPKAVPAAASSARKPAGKSKPTSSSSK